MQTKTSKTSSSDAEKSNHSSRQEIAQGRSLRRSDESRGSLINLVRTGSKPIQTKMKISSPGDRYELEADAVADRVMRMPVSPKQSQRTDTVQLQEEEEVQTPEAENLQLRVEEEAIQQQEEEEETIQAQEMEEEELQAQPIEEEEEMQLSPQLLRQEEEEEPIQMQEMEEEEMLQTQTETDRDLRTARSDMRDRLQSTGGGDPLSQSTRVFMEDRIGRDFGAVRVHTGPEASEMSRDLRAQAFTRGRDIYFNEGRYNPETSAGRRLLAHELTHVVQQGAAERNQERKSGASPSQNHSGEDSARESETKELSNVQQEITRREASQPASGESTQLSAADETRSEVREQVGAISAGHDEKPSESPAEREVDGSQFEGEVSVGREGAAESRGWTESPAPEAVEGGPGEGSAAETVQSFTRSGATEIARNLPSLGESLNEQLSRDQETTAAETPALQARIPGTDEIRLPESRRPTPEHGVISEGITSERGVQERPAGHENAGETPRNDERVDEVERQADGGFLSWLRTNFSGFMGRIRTADPGLRTGAGERPTVDTSGSADPRRAVRQTEEGRTRVVGQRDRTAAAIRANRGQEEIQPVRVDETMKPDITADRRVSLETSSDENVAHYADRDDLTPAVRTAADRKMAPGLQQNLAGPRAEVKAAARERDQQKASEIARARQETEALNRNAREEQRLEVQASRQEVADTQKAGVAEADRKMREFDTEATEKETEARRAVEERITDDEGKAAKKLSDAESEAAKKKREAERQAQAKKRELEAKKEDQSWWDRAVSAVKSAVKAITGAIDAIFSAVRQAVTAIINAARDAALAIIEAGRRWITEKLDQFASWLKEKVTQVVGRLFPELAERINRVIDQVVKRAKTAVNAVADRLSRGVRALADRLSSAIDSILSKFQTALKSAVQIVGAVVTGDFAAAARIAFMAACEVAGINPQPILDFLHRAGSALMLIFRDPIGFFLNVVNGVKKGLQQFLNNIIQHLVSGLIGWLTGALAETGITLPERWDVRGVFHLAMQILGLTYQNIRTKVVRKLGPRGEQIVSTIENTVSFIQDFIKRGPVALWDRVKDFLGNIKEQVLSGIRNWVVTQIVKQGIMWLFSLLNPASALVRAIKLLYDLVMFFVNRWTQIVSFARSVFESVGALAMGQLGRAANAVEQALARSVPVILSFLASLLGLGGIGKAVRNVISRIRRPVDRAVDRVIGWIVEKGRALLQMGGRAIQQGVQGVRRLLFPSRRFRAGEQSHTIWVDEGTPPRLMISSDTKLMTSFIDGLKSRDDLPHERKKKITQVEVILGKIQPLLQQIQQKEKAGRDVTKVQQRVIDLEVELAAILREILVYDNPLETREKYKLEGWVATYGTMPRAKFDKLTPDHQPQASLLKYVAVLPEFSGRGVQQVIKGSHVDGGYAINLHQLRHKAGRTYGSKGKGTLNTTKANIRAILKPIPVTHTEKRRAAVLDVVRDEIDADVKAMNSVVKNKKNFNDIEATMLDADEKASLTRDIRSRIESGENRLRTQNLDRLKRKS